MPAWPPVPMEKNGAPGRGDRKGVRKILPFSAGQGGMLAGERVRVGDDKKKSCSEWEQLFLKENVSYED